MIALGAGAVGAQISGEDAKQLGPFPQGMRLKVSSNILHALSLRSRRVTPDTGWAIDTAAMDINAQGLQVYIELEAFEPGIVAQLQGQGANIEIVAPDRRLIQARLPLDRIQQVSQLRFVKFISLPNYGVPNQQGSVGTEGDAVMRTSMVRQYLGVTGTGIRVGVISDGIRGLSQSIASGALPPQGGTSRSFRADGNLNAGGEGTAIIEIIYDIAPGVQLFFANISTELEFIQAVNWLAAEAGGPNPRRGTPGGVDVIVEDFSFFNAGPYDGSSSVS